MARHLLDQTYTCASPKWRSSLNSRLCAIGRASRKLSLMLRILRVIMATFCEILRSRRDLLLENLALRQQLAILAKKRPQSRLSSTDKLFWIVLRRLWPGWRRALLIVEPSTVIRWNSKGFKLYWKWISRHRVHLGRKPVSKELRELIFRMVAENPTWGAPRIHGEMTMLGFDIAERTVLRWMRKAPGGPIQRGDGRHF